MSSDPIIRLRNVSKRFGKTQALDQVSIEVPPGVVFALLGENGAGKTTMIRILLGLETPDAGTAEVLGLNSKADSLEIRRRIGYVAERPTLYDWMTVDQIGWFAAGFYAPGYLENYRSYIRQYELDPNQKLKNMSKGMKAKVGLSLAMSHNPSLLILDEPTSGLDTLVRREFLESMVDLTANGRSVFLSSHQIIEVERVADIVAIVRGGKILLIESLDELKKTSVEVTATLQPGNLPFEIAGPVVHREVSGRQARILIRGHADDVRETMLQHPAVQSVDVATPSLEDIFIAYMKSESVPSFVSDASGVKVS
ncbi:MAG: ABC transporter ATP-binding protein [Planctomycetales bacterium]|nr:ABC transporter ATP-binding protein [Planctomycetales bacterium]